MAENNNPIGESDRLVFDIAATQAYALAKSNRAKIQDIQNRIVDLQTSLEELKTFLHIHPAEEVTSNRDREIL